MSIGFKDDTGLMSICRPKLYLYMPRACQWRRSTVRHEQVNGYPPRKSPTIRAIAMSKARTEKANSYKISPAPRHTQM